MNVHPEMETEGLTPAWNTPALCRLCGGACGVPACPGWQRQPCWSSAGALSCLGAVLCCAVGGSLVWGRAQCLGLTTHVELRMGSERDAVCSGPGRQRCVFVFRAIFRMVFVLLVKHFRR